jgi:hypothetical protein
VCGKSEQSRQQVLMYYRSVKCVTSYILFLRTSFFLAEVPSFAEMLDKLHLFFLRTSFFLAEVLSFAEMRDNLHSALLAGYQVFF